MTWQRPKPPPAAAKAGTQLVTECEAFLSGAYAAYLQAQHMHVPAWAWINRLAHGTQADIERLAANDDGDTPDALTSCIAAHLIDATQQRGISLDSLQHNNLIPLETLLVASANAGAAPPQDQDDLARSVASALATRSSTSPPSRPGPL